MIKKIIIPALFLFSGFVSVANAQIEGGSFFVDSSTQNYTLNKNEGKREVFVEFNFAKPFLAKPTVLTSLSLLDISGEKFEIHANTSTTIETKGLRVVCKPTGVSRDGFVLKITVWGKTQINAVGGNWIAFEQ
jgi:hypothetical protein